MRPSIAPLALLPVLAACSGNSGPVEGSRAMEHVHQMVSLGPRPAGSEALERAGDYLVGQIRELGLEPREQKWEEVGIGFRNIWTEIPGADPESGPILALGAHYDTKKTEGHPLPEQNFRFVGAIDGGGASGLLLELARVLIGRANRPNIWLIWFDGEESIPYEWDNERSLYGSKHFVETMSRDTERFPQGLGARMKAFVLLDLIGAADIKIDRDGNSNKELQDMFLRAAEQMGEEDRVYRYDSGSGFTDDHIPFRNYGVTSALLIDLVYRAPGQMTADGTEYSQWWHTTMDTIDKMSEDAMTFAGNLVWNALPMIEVEFFE